MSKTYSKTRILVECASDLSLLARCFPTSSSSLHAHGGSITLLSMLPFVLVSFRHGAKWGLFTGFVNSCLQNDHGLLPASRFTFPLLPR